MKLYLLACSAAVALAYVSCLSRSDENALVVTSHLVENLPSSH